MKTIKLNQKQVDILTTELNLSLRGNWGDESRIVLNGIFRKLVGRNHESMEVRGLVKKQKLGRINNDH